MSDSERLALAVLGWKGTEDGVTFIVAMAAAMGVDLSALTQALLREQVRREVATHREPTMLVEPECSCGYHAKGLGCEPGCRLARYQMAVYRAGL